jgi:hypothetical protein
MEDDPPYLSAARLHRQAKLNCFGMKHRTPFQGEWARNKPVLAALAKNRDASKYIVGQFIAALHCRH